MEPRLLRDRLLGSRSSIRRPSCYARAPLRVILTLWEEFTSCVSENPLLGPLSMCTA